QEAVALFTDLLGERHPTTARGFTNLAGHYVRSKDYPRALDYQSRAVRAARYNLALAADIGSEAMQLTAFGRFRRDLDAYLTIADRAGSPPEAMWAEVLAWKGAVFTRQAFLRDAARDPALAPLATDLRQTSARLAEVHLGDPQARGKVSGRADPLAEKRDGLERQLAAAAAARGLTPPAPPTPDEVRAALPEDAVLVDYFCRPPRLLAFVARRGRPVVRVDLGELPAVERAVAAWRRVYGRTDRDGSDPG